MRGRRSKAPEKKKYIPKIGEKSRKGKRTGCANIKSPKLNEDSAKGIRPRFRNAFQNRYIYSIKEIYEMKILLNHAGKPASYEQIKKYCIFGMIPCYKVVRDKVYWQSDYFIDLKEFMYIAMHDFKAFEIHPDLLKQWRISS